MAIFKRTTVYQYKCCRCEHEWNPRKGVVPVRCGGCKTPYWNVPKPKTVAEETTEYQEMR